MRQLFRAGYLEVVTGEGDRQVVARMYLSGDIVRWVRPGLLSLPAEEFEDAWTQHAEQLNALWKPWLRRMLAVQDGLERGRWLARWTGGIGSTLWGGGMAGTDVLPWELWQYLLVPMLVPVAHWISVAVLGWVVDRQLRKLRGEE